jgi:hypothetical protein
MEYEKTVTEADVLEALERGEVKLPPLEIKSVSRRTGREVEPGPQPQARLTVRWNGKAYRFAATCRRLWTRRAVSEAADAALRATEAGGPLPLVVVPYLGEEQLGQLEAKGVSGIDLCGNGVVVVPGELLVWRSGSPNRFRWSAAIKNVYRRDSSLVSRAFLLVGRFGSVQEGLAEVRRRGGKLSLGTVSKVCQSLEEDLIIARERADSAVAQRMRLLQPDKLLDRLGSAFVPPAIAGRFVGRCQLEGERLVASLQGWEKRTGNRVVLTGAGSVNAYAVMAREPVQQFYCSDIASLVRELGEALRETDRFANIELLQTKDQTAYFDRRDGLVASPIQAYLELNIGEKRERQTAEQVRRAVLEPLARLTREG